MITLVAATTNKHKIREYRELFAHRPILIKALSEFTNYPEVIEDGSTFQENAARKARACFEYLHLPVFADDSGLEVPALNNAPGVFSARYSGEDATYEKNNRLLLERMRDLPEAQRKARFVCAICYKDDKEERRFTGITEGIILNELRGHGGFGYDPLFYVPVIKKTYAELTLEEKNQLSHRSEALQQLLYYLDQTLLRNI